jgi:hypothetical protein
MALVVKHKVWVCASHRFQTFDTAFNWFVLFVTNKINKKKNKPEIGTLEFHTSKDPCNYTHLERMFIGGVLGSQPSESLVKIGIALLKEYRVKNHQNYQIKQVPGSSKDRKADKFTAYYQQYQQFTQIVQLST